MKNIKGLKYVLLMALLMALANKLEAQWTYAPDIGLSSSFLTSDKIKSSPGIGITLGGGTQLAVGYKTDFFVHYDMTLGDFGVTATDITGTYKTETTAFIAGSLDYMLGFDYWLVRKKFNISAAAFINYGFAVPGANDQDVVGNPNGRSTGLDAIGSTLTTWNYGPALGAAVAIDEKHELGLRVCIGLRNLTSGILDDNNNIYHTGFNTVLVTYRFRPFSGTIAKVTNNKLIK